MDTELERRSSQPAELSPEQLRLVSAEFDKVWPHNRPDQPNLWGSKGCSSEAPYVAL